jgi:hypothetical protein
MTSTSTTTTATPTDAAAPKTFTEYARQVLNSIRSNADEINYYITYDAAANYVKEKYDEISKIRTKECVPFLYAIAYDQMHQILREEKPFKSQRKLSHLLYASMLDICKIDDKQYYSYPRPSIILEDIQEAINKLAQEYDGPL